MTSSSRIRLFEAPFLVIEYDAADKLLIQNWKGYATSAQFREGIEASVKIFKERKVIGLLSNTRDSAVVNKKDTEWAATYGIGSMLENGLKAVAFTIPTSTFAGMSVANFKEQAAGAPFAFRYFDDVEEAVAWLISFK